MEDPKWKQTRVARWAVRHPVLSIFALGLSIRMIGGVAIWAGDGHRNFFAKAVVGIGVALSVLGIGVLKWLSMRPRRSKAKPARPLPK